ncbi:hypothetical protein, partial [Streptococcus pneumoniae]
FYRSEHQKRKDEICPFSSLAFLQPTTVDKEPQKKGETRGKEGKFPRFSNSLSHAFICLLNA